MLNGILNYSNVMDHVQLLWPQKDTKDIITHGFDKVIDIIYFNVNNIKFLQKKVGKKSY